MGEYNLNYEEIKTDLNNSTVDYVPDGSTNLSDMSLGTALEGEAAIIHLLELQNDYLAFILEKLNELLYR